MARLTLKEFWAVYAQGWKDFIALFFKKVPPHGFRKTWKNLFKAVAYLFLFVNVILIPITLMSSTTLSQWAFTIIHLTIGWWLFYLFLFVYAAKNGYHKPQQNYKKAYEKTVAERDRIHKKCNYYMRTSVLRKREVQAYHDFIDRMRAEGKISKEDLDGAFKRREEYIANTPQFKNMK